MTVQEVVDTLRDVNSMGTSRSEIALKATEMMGDAAETYTKYLIYAIKHGDDIKSTEENSPKIDYNFDYATYQRLKELFNEEE